MKIGTLVWPALLLATPAFARDAITAAEHVVKVDGARNFRDAGGYRTADGRTVRRGAFYRSGSIGRLTPEGRRELRALGVTSIVDLRTREERARDGDDWLAHARLGYWARDYSLSQGDLGKRFADPAQRTPEAMRRTMIEAYKMLPFEQAPSYRVLFARLAAPAQGAVLVNCTAGKDRTGIAAALVLTALGVPYATVRQDFLLSNQTVDPRELQASLSGGIPGVSREAMMPLLTVDGAYLDAAFAAMRAKDGSIAGYLRKELGVGPPELAAIRKRLLV